MIATLAKVKEKPRGYWIRLVVFLFIGAFAASWIGHWNVWIDARFKIYQALQSLLPGRGKYVEDTFLVLIHDEDYWKGELRQRVPVRRDYLAKLVRALNSDDAGIIVLDFDLRSAVPSGNVSQDNYKAETEDLEAAIKDASENIRAVILPKTIGLDDDGNYITDADVVDSFSFNDHVHRGYIALPYDLRQLPMTLSLKDHSKIDSLAEATVRAWNQQALGDSPESESGARFAGFLSRDKFDPRIIDAGALLQRPKDFKPTLQSKIVIVGGDWHVWAYGRGPHCDSYDTPAGELPGSLIHANYVEALLAGRTYKPMTEWVSKFIEVLLVLLTVFVFALEFRPLYKALSVVALYLACVFISYFAFTNFGIFFDFLIPLIAVTLHAGLEQIIEWRDLAQKWSEYEASLRSAAKTAVGILVLGMTLFSGFHQYLYAFSGSWLGVPQSDSQNTSDKPAKPIDPNKPGGPREASRPAPLGTRSGVGGSAAIQRELTEHYPLTKATADKTDIVTAGAVLVLEKDNLLMFAVNTTVPAVNTYKNGKISRGGFDAAMKCNFCLKPGVSSAPAQVPDVDKRTFVSGEKFWVTDIEVHDDGIVFDLLSDEYAGFRYHSQLRFPFPKGSLPSIDAVMHTIADVIKVQPDNSVYASSGHSAHGTTTSAGQRAQGIGQEQNQGAMAPIPPPPPPPDAPPVSQAINKGLTKDEVVAILGQPSKIIKLSAKEIYIYPDMKVTFVEGKVTDVQ